MRCNNDPQVFDLRAVLLFVLQITLMFNTLGVGVPPSLTLTLGRPVHLLTPSAGDPVTAGVLYPYIRITN